MIRRKHISIDGITISYLIAGKGSPILLLHGAGTEARTYEHHIEHLAQNHLIIAPDIPLFGKSDLPDRIFSFDDYAALFVLMLETLKLQNVKVIGYSFGGGIAARMHNCTLIQSIYLCSPAIQNLRVQSEDLSNLVLKEFISSLQHAKKREEKLLFMKVVQDFLKNVVKCKNKQLMMDIMINTLNIDYDVRVSDKIRLIRSLDDPLLPQNHFTSLADRIQILDVRGSHLWFLIRDTEYKKVYQALR